MHFPIIKLSSDIADATERIDLFDFSEDSLIQYHCDYFGEDISEEDRERYLVQLKNVFRGLARVDVGQETIEFFSKEEILETLRANYARLLGKLESRLNEGYMGLFFLRQSGFWYNDYQIIFCVDGCTYTSGQFIEDCHYYAGQKFYIGNMLDAHC